MAPACDDPDTVPNFEVRNRLRLAHEHAAASTRRAAAVHEEAAHYWEQIYEVERAEDHRNEADRWNAIAAEHDEQARIYTETPDYLRGDRTPPG